MKISFIEVSSSGNLRDFSLEFEANGCTVIHEPEEKTSCAILALLAGVDDITSGRLLIDGMDYGIYFLNHEHLEIFSYVFDEGIMLANLSLRENLLLPYRKRFEDRSLEDFDRDVNGWMAKLHLTLDLNLRPVMIDAAERKYLSVIRGLITEPKLLMIDDPYYLLNKTQRRLMLEFLKCLKKQQPMLIASADDDFLEGFADQVIDLRAQGISCAGSAK